MQKHCRSRALHKVVHAQKKGEKRKNVFLLYLEQHSVVCLSMIHISSPSLFHKHLSVPLPQTSLFPSPTTSTRLQIRSVYTNTCFKSYCSQTLSREVPGHLIILVHIKAIRLEVSKNHHHSCSHPLASPSPLHTLSSRCSSLRICRLHLAAA